MNSVGRLIVPQIGVKDVPVFDAAWPLCPPNEIVGITKEVVRVEVPLIPRQRVVFALHRKCSVRAQAY